MNDDPDVVADRGAGPARDQPDRDVRGPLGNGGGLVDRGGVGLGFNWHALVAVILALGAATTIVLLAVMELIRDGNVTAEEATLLSTALGAVVGAVATYLGIGRKQD